MAKKGNKKGLIAGMSIGPKGVDIHPEFWDDISEFSAEEQEEIIKMIQSFKAAMEIAVQRFGPRITQEQLNIVLKEVIGEDVDAELGYVNTLSEEEQKVIEERIKSIPTKH